MEADRRSTGRERVAMRDASVLRRICWAGLVVVTMTTGCTHNYYYGTAAGCLPAGQTYTTQVGQVCEVPSGAVMTSSAATPGGGAQVAAAAQPQRVVISQPAYGPSFSNRYRWHRADPESLATTRSDGALQESIAK